MKERVWVVKTNTKVLGVYRTSEAAQAAKILIDITRLKLGALGSEYHSTIERFEVES